MKGTNPLLMILLVFVLFSSCTFVAAFGKKPAPPPKEADDESIEIVRTPATLKRKMTSFLVGSVAASTTDFIVHRFVNETQRHEYKYDKVKYKETYIYAGEFSNTGRINLF